jgi:hypothetical protein
LSVKSVKSVIFHLSYCPSLNPIQFQKARARG